MLSPEVIIAWQIPNETVPIIAKEPKRVPSHVMSNQLQPISENAAKYDIVIGNGMWSGLTRASAKFSMLSSFSYPWWISMMPMDRRSNKNPNDLIITRCLVVEPLQGIQTLHVVDQQVPSMHGVLHSIGCSQYRTSQTQGLQLLLSPVIRSRRL